MPRSDSEKPVAAAASLYDKLRDGQNVNLRRGQLSELRQRMHHKVIEEVGAVVQDASIDERVAGAEVRRVVQRLLQEESAALSAAEKIQLVQDLLDDILGHGPIEPYLNDPSVSEVMVNGPYEIYVERNGRLERVGGTFVDEPHLRRVVERIVAAVGRRIDESSPMVDARLADGSRINAVFPPLSPAGPYLTVRKFAADPFSVNDLVEMGTLTHQVADFLRGCVEGRLNMVVSGGTGTGKTTLLNVVSSFIPASERIVTIEDSKELQLRQQHVLSLEARPPNIEGRGEVSIRDLVRNSLRMRPDRIIVGECRSGEALDMLQAMNTGHDGSISTVHANSPRDALSRIETMTLMAGFDLPVRVIREQMASALDLIVHLSRMRDGSRRVTQVTEIERLEGEVVVMQDIFAFDPNVISDTRQGLLQPTGLRPKFSQRLADHGIVLTEAMLTPADTPLKRPR